MSHFFEQLQTETQSAREQFLQIEQLVRGASGDIPLASFRSLINRLDNRDDQQAVIHMANMMYRLYGDVFRSIPLN